METKILVLTADQAVTLIRNTISEELKKWKDEQAIKEGEKLWTINKVAKHLKKSHSTIKKMCKSGLIKTTRNGLITQNAINDFLLNQDSGYGNHT
jgi:hypothetical protein